MNKKIKNELSQPLALDLQFEESLNIEAITPLAPETSEENLSTLPIELMFLTLPYKASDETIFIKSKIVEDYKWTLRVEALAVTYEEGKNNLPYGLPYGIYPRLLLYYICSEAKRSNSSEITLGESFKEVLKNIKINDKDQMKVDGKQIDILAAQYFKLMTSRILLEKRFLGKDKIDFSGEFFNIIKGFKFEGDKNHIDFKIKLDTAFFDFIIKADSTVFSTDVIPHLKSSPMLLDLYVYFNYIAFSSNKFKVDQFISWKTLYEQFGTSHTLKGFKQNMKKNIEKLVLIHPSLSIKYGDNKNGEAGLFILKNSKPIIESREYKKVNYHKKDKQNTKDKTK
ncbi:Plasmid encoded RepA protein [Candidatus Hepatincolaceae symbiont of Richtersius coronifer]